jgi:SAM-dependent methyltransferase
MNAQSKGGPSMNCPICGISVGLPLLEIEFSESVLPRRYPYSYCSDCDFGFSRPEALTNSILERYYAGLPEEHAEGFPNIERIVKQIKVITENIQLSSKSRILDFGCGQGSLLEMFHREFLISPENLVGHDVQSVVIEGRNFTFEPKLELINGKFDLIVISHALEHLLSFDILNLLRKFLSESGVLYIEVPNAQRYLNYPRSAPGFYLDRPHVNHFTPKSMFKILDQNLMRILSVRESSFTYIDGNEYPALCIFSSARFEKNFMELEIAAGFDAASKLALSSIVGDEVVIWGAGDNFHRHHAFGAFEKLNIVALCDRDKVGTRIEGFPEITNISEAIKNFPKATYLV